MPSTSPSAQQRVVPVRCEETEPTDAETDGDDADEETPRRHRCRAVHPSSDAEADDAPLRQGLPLRGSGLAPLATPLPLVASPRVQQQHDRHRSRSSDGTLHQNVQHARARGRSDCARLASALAAVCLLLLLRSLAADELPLSELALDPNRTRIACRPRAHAVAGQRISCRVRAFALGVDRELEALPAAARLRVAARVADSHGVVLEAPAVEPEPPTTGVDDAMLATTWSLRPARVGRATISVAVDRGARWGGFIGGLLDSSARAPPLASARIEVLPGATELGASQLTCSPPVVRQGDRVACSLRHVDAYGNPTEQPPMIGPGLAAVPVLTRPLGVAEGAIGAVGATLQAHGLRGRVIDGFEARAAGRAGIEVQLGHHPKRLAAWIDVLS